MVERLIQKSGISLSRLCGISYIYIYIHILVPKTGRHTYLSHRAKLSATELPLESVCELVQSFASQTLLYPRQVA